ncbi:MAG: hypothetical protein ACO22T_12125 [Burkholderiales bacterium]|jgi:hypothetical protein
METLYKWRMQEKDKFGKARWRLVRMLMTEETARFWARNNNLLIERVDWPGAVKFSLQLEDPVRTETGKAH